MIRGSTTKPSRTKAYSVRYRTIAPNSQVDELLFGKTDQVASRRNSGTQAKVESQRNRGEKIQIITKDLIRDVRVPPKEPTGRALILTKAQFDKMTSGILTLKEREAQRKAFQLKKEKDLKDAEDRRKLIEKFDRQNPELTELERKARVKAKRLVEQANAVKMEEEDEIKQMNQLILGVQCQASRDRQIQEKKMTRKEMAAEERRLTEKKEQERRNHQEARDKIDEQRKQQRIRGRQQIKDQIQQHQLERKRQEEIKKQERQQFREKQEQKKLEDLRAREKKRQEQMRLQEEIRRINAEAMQAKKLKREQEKLAEMNDLKYMQKKLEKEAKYEAEQLRIKKQKHVENAQLWAKQKRDKESKAEQDKRQAKRDQEVIEREWRRTEKEKATKKLQKDNTLKAVRLEQVRDKEHCLANEIRREMATFQTVLKATQGVMIKDKEKQERQHQKAHRNMQAIQKQIQDRKTLTTAKRRELLLEANQQKEEARLKQLRIDELKEKKLKELAATGLAPKYCKEVMRKTLRAR